MLWKSKKKKPAGSADFERFYGDLSQAASGPVNDAEGTAEAESNGVAEVDKAEEAARKIVAQEEEKASAREREFQQLKGEVHREVVNKIDLATVGTMNDADLQREIRRNAELVLAGATVKLTAEERTRIVSEVIDETFGMGPLEGLFRDNSITDIMINGAHTVYVERNGRLQKSNVRFANDEHVVKIIQRIVGAIGRRIDETSPMVDGRLRDGSRINAIIPPLALDGPLVSIRRFGARPLQSQDLIDNRSIMPVMLDFLKACVRGRQNMLISGGTGSGKTTLLNILSGSISNEERVATIEDAAELQLQQPHVIRMETRPPNIEGEGQVTTRDLVRNALRMRPDRIIVGECRGPEALDMLQAMNTGHDGSITTIHANTPRDALMRLEMMVGMTGVDIPVWTIRRQIASAINIVVQVVRLTGGARKIVRISEITGMEGEIITMHDLFEFRQSGIDADGVAFGDFATTGVRPGCLERLETSGISISPSVFEERVLNMN